MNDTDIQAMIKRHEGFKNKVYTDSVVVPTGGWGHAFLKDSPIPISVAVRFFEEDFKAAVADYGRFCTAYDLRVDPVRRGVLIDMLFNLGLPRLSKFKKMIAALQVNDFDEAAVQMKDSKWYRQTKSRAVELVKIMRTGRV